MLFIDLGYLRFTSAGGGDINGDGYLDFIVTREINYASLIVVLFTS